MELQLICHGMMLFWYRESVKSANATDGYQILIPQGRINNQLVHELRLGPGSGAKVSSLGYDDQDPNTLATQYWQLDFGNIESTKERGQKSKDKNLTFYGNSSTRTKRRTGIKKEDAGVAFVIDIPYPLKECPIRAMDYKKNPYLNPSADGKRKARVVEAFNVRPKTIVSARVFHFSINNNVPITLYRPATNTRRDIVANPSGSIIQIHLYNQAPEPPSDNRENHLPLFNKMLQLTTNSNNTHTEAPFDLELNPDRDGAKAKLDTSQTVRGKDLSDLWEFLEFDETGKVRNPSDIRAYDPAECGQGSGCNHPDLDPDPDPDPILAKATNREKV
jgi:hypothetical protein